MPINFSLQIHPMKHLFQIVPAVWMLTLSLSMWSQTTIESSDLPQGGETYPIVNTTVLDLNLLNLAGADVTWDFSNLIELGDAPITPSPMSEASITASIAFNSPFNAAYQCDFFLPTVFPDLGIDLGIPLDGFNNFYQTNNDYYAIAGIGLSSAGFDLPVPYDDIDEFFPLPFSFGESFSSTGSFALDLTGILGYWLDQTREVTADAWGTLMLPSGAYDVLRIRTELSAVDSVYIEQLGEPFVIDREQVIYQWWANGHGFPLLEVTTTGGIPSWATFQDLGTPNGIASHEGDDRLELYPNPAKAGSSITWNVVAQNWKFLDSSGRTLDEGLGNDMHLPSDLPSGVYFIVVNGLSSRLLIQ
jgi:hypothetical protein